MGFQVSAALARAWSSRGLIFKIYPSSSSAPSKDGAIEERTWAGLPTPHQKLDPFGLASKFLIQGDHGEGGISAAFA